MSKRLLLICAFSLLSAVAWGQVPEKVIHTDDIRLWTGGTIKFEFTKDFRLEVEQQYRIDDTISNYESSFTEIGLRYEFTDWLDAKGQYRYTSEAEGRNASRLSLDISAEYDIPDFPVDIEYRFRITDSKVDYTREKDTYLRNRFGLDWNMSKLVDPYFEYESFFKLNENKEFRTDRYTMGLQWKINDETELETYYRIEDEFNTDNPETQHIIGLMIDYEIEFH